MSWLEVSERCKVVELVIFSAGKHGLFLLIGLAEGSSEKGINVLMRNLFVALVCALCGCSEAVVAGDSEGGKSGAGGPPPQNLSFCDVPLFSAFRDRQLEFKTGWAGVSGVCADAILRDYIAENPSFAQWRSLDLENFPNPLFGPPCSTRVLGVAPFFRTVMTGPGPLSVYSEQRRRCDPESGMLTFCGRRYLIGTELRYDLFAEGTQGQQCSPRYGVSPGGSDCGPLWRSHSQVSFRKKQTSAAVWGLRLPGDLNPSLAVVGSVFFDTFPAGAVFDMQATIVFVPDRDENPLTIDDPVVVYDAVRTIAATSTTRYGLGVALPLNSIQGATVFSGDGELLGRAGEFVVDVRSHFHSPTSEYEVRSHGGVHVWLAEDPSVFGIPSLKASSPATGLVHDKECGTMNSGSTHFVQGIGCANDTVQDALRVLVEFSDPERAPGLSVGPSSVTLSGAASWVFSRDSERWIYRKDLPFRVPAESPSEADVVWFEAGGSICQDIALPPAPCFPQDSDSTTFRYAYVLDVYSPQALPSGPLRVRFVPNQYFFEPMATAPWESYEFGIRYPVSPADIADTDGNPVFGGDGVVDNGDFQLFFIAFFLPESDPLRLRADIANTDGQWNQWDLCGAASDGVVDNGDFQLFFESYLP